MLIGSRIRLRAIERSEIPMLTGWFNDPEIRQYIPLYWTMSQADEERWFDQMLQRPPELHPMMIDALTPEGWQPIGDCGFNEVSWVNRSGEIGIVIGDRRYWGKGYGSDAVRMLLRYGFTALNLNRIELEVYQNNPRAIRSYEKVGFVHEGRKRQAMFKSNVYQDVLIMAVLRSEWEDTRI
ncbi:MAG TPA: GNAT family protein [Anaerolineaceae bacterium]